MLRLFRIAIYLLVAAAAVLAVIGLRRRSTPHLLASLAILLLLAAGFPLAIWLERSPAGAPASVDARTWAQDAQRTLGQIRLTSFDDVARCLVYTQRLVEFYRRYPAAYGAPLAQGEALLERWAVPPSPQDLRRPCTEVPDLHRYVLAGRRRLAGGSAPPPDQQGQQAAEHRAAE